MRVVAVADTHQFHDELVLPAGDVLLSAGDAGRGGDVDELGGFFEWLSDQPHTLKVFVPGNHDGCLQHQAVLAAMRAAFPAVHILVDEGCVIDGLRLWGSPWTPTFHDWAFMLSRGALLAERWACIPTRHRRQRRRRRRRRRPSQLTASHRVSQMEAGARCITMGSQPESVDTVQPWLVSNLDAFEVSSSNA